MDTSRTPRTSSDRFDDVHRQTRLRFEAPTPDDGPAIAALVARSRGLDPNSPYAYVMLCDVFRSTVVVARDGRDAIVGFVSGFRRPDDPGVLFLWQIAVDEDARGRGMGAALLDAFVSTEGARGALHLETTVTPDNTSSLAMFERFAARSGSSFDRVGRYEAAWLGDHHAPEDLYRMRLAPHGTRS